MGTAMDAIHNAPSSLTNRRSLQSQLPNFELPPPNNLQFTTSASNKYPPFSHFQHPSSSAVSVGNLLTPPSNSASDGGSGSSGMPTGTNVSSSAPGPVLPYTPTFFNSGGATGYHTGLTPQPWQGSNPLFPTSRHPFSPLNGPLMRINSNSPTAGEGTALPPPPIDLSNGPFASSYGLSSPPGASLQNFVRPPSQQSPTTASDTMVSKPSAPSLYTNMGPAHGHQPSGYPYSNSTPVSQSPHSANGPAQRHSPPMHQVPTPQQSQSPFIRPPYPSYTLPNMPGPTMTNVNSPGAQMSMVGNVGGALPLGFNSGYAANPSSLYGQQRTNSPAQNPQTDRPFRCDSCPQSFHRNHDLKRHKRIHLAVKPFPCKHCDKSFSRKDALKRHILVKGCGNRGSSNDDRDDGVKSESGSDQISESPIISVAV